MRSRSVAACALMVAGILWLVQRGDVLALGRITIGVQLLAVLLMVAARSTFGMRSFHAAANPTAGCLVTSGPYRWLRHPIYSAVLYFVWAAALDHRNWPAVAAATLVTCGAAIRMHAEEGFLRQTYPGYEAYAARTARVIPGVL